MTTSLNKFVDKNSTASLLVIDADWLCFVASMAVETRFVEIYDSKDETKFIGKYKHKTEFKKSKDFVTHPDAIIRDCQKVSETNYLSSAKYKLQSDIKKYLKASGCTEVLLCMSGKSNFRDRVPLSHKYKGSRDDTLRPLKLKEIRALAATLYPTVYADDEEADDIISKYQFQSWKDPSRRIVVCTLDKDARGTPGWLYNPNYETLVFIEGLGFLRLDEKISAAGKKSNKLYGEGRKWFYTQLLTGDQADDYYPNSMIERKDNITDLRAYKLLGPLTTDKECWLAIIATYQHWYPRKMSWTTFDGVPMEGTWKDILQMYIDIVHMRRFDGDRVELSKILEKYEIA